MRFALDVAQAKDFSFRNPGEMGRFKPSFSRFAPFLAALLRAQDGLLPSEDNNSLLANTRFAKPNRLNNCAVFLNRPL